MRPIVMITIDGQPVSGLFMSRLVKVTVCDKEGAEADTVDMELEAGLPYLAVPRKKAVIQVSMGSDVSGVGYLGSYTADDITLEMIPWRMQVRGKAADMRAGLKSHKERHWDDKTFGDVVGEIAQENGLEAQVAPAIASARGADGYWSQERESGLHFIERHAKRLNGLFTVKDGKLIVAEKGSGTSPGGGAMGVVIITPPMLQRGSGKITWGQRESAKKVRAGWHDRAEGKQKYEEADADPDGEVPYTLRQPFTTKDEAKRAAESKAEDLGRNADSASATVLGDPSIKAGAPMEFQVGHPDADGQRFIIETATHTWSKSSGYMTQIQARNPGKSPGKAKGK